MHSPAEGEAAAWGAHPNAKPFAVLEPLVRNFSIPGQLVFDPFAGSGSTLLAAHRLGRCASGVERDEKWQATAQRRISAVQDRQ